MDYSEIFIYFEKNLLKAPEAIIPMKYLKSRLRISILGQLVILLYVLGTGVLVYTDFEGIGQWSDSWKGLFTFWGIYLLLLLPFDLMAGYSVPRKYGRYLDSLGKWLLNWSRGVLVLTGLFALHSGALILLGGWAGLKAGTGWVFLWMLLLTGFRQYLARLVAPFKIRYDSNRGRLIFYFDTQDRGFTGGITGMPGQESIVMPAYWQEKWKPEVFDLQLSRRHGALNTGSHGFGLFGSIFVHTGLFALCMFLAGEPGRISSLILTYCLYTLVSSLASIGLMPLLNRRGTYQMDRWVFYKKVDGDIINAAIENSRRLQDDPGYGLGRALRPTASLAERQAQRKQGKDIKGAWHLASVWYYYAMLTGNFFVRALPPNLGLPSRWIFTPME